MLSILESDDAEGDTFPRLYQPPTDEDSLAAVALAECPAIPFPASCPPDTGSKFGRFPNDPQCPTTKVTTGAADPVAYLVLLNTQADDLAIGLFFEREPAFTLARAACFDPHTHAAKCPQLFFSDVYLGAQVVEFVGTEPKFVTLVTIRDVLTDSPLADPA